MKQTLALVVLGCAMLCVAGRADAQVTVTVDPGASWLGFMNVFETPQTSGAYVFGSPWGTADLVATFSGPVLTLAPNTIGDPSPFWHTPSGGPGATGNKIMDANLYIEPAAGTFTNQTLTFTGNVLANSLVGNVNQQGNGWTSVAFIKDFAPDYSSFVQTTAALTPGVFSISLLTINDPARHVQYGFETIGPDVWITDVGPFGSVQVTAIPEPGTFALMAVAAGGLMGLVRGRRD